MTLTPTGLQINTQHVQSKVSEAIAEANPKVVRHLQQFDVLKLFAYLKACRSIKDMTEKQLREHSSVCSVLDFASRPSDLLRWFREKTLHSKYGIHNVITVPFLGTKELAHGSQKCWSIPVSVEHHDSDTRVCTPYLIEQYQKVAQVDKPDQDLNQKVRRMSVEEKLTHIFRALPTKANNCTRVPVKASTISSIISGCMEAAEIDHGHRPDLAGAHPIQKRTPPAHL